MSPARWESRGGSGGAPPDPTRSRLPATLIGLIVGLALGFAGAFGGFTAFIVVLVLGAVGTLVGLVIDGRIDPTALVNRDRDGR